LLYIYSKSLIHKTYKPGLTKVKALMSVSLMVDGSSFIKNLLNAYNWQKESLAGVEGGAFLPTLNILYSGVSHPPENIFSRFLAQAQQEFNDMLKNIKRFEPGTFVYDNLGLPKRTALLLRSGESKVENFPDDKSERTWIQPLVRYKNDGRLIQPAGQLYVKMDCYEASEAFPANAEDNKAQSPNSRGSTFDVLVV